MQDNWHHSEGLLPALCQRSSVCLRLPSCFENQLQERNLASYCWVNLRWMVSLGCRLSCRSSKNLPRFLMFRLLHILSATRPVWVCSYLSFRHSDWESVVKWEVTLKVRSTADLKQLLNPDSSTVHLLFLGLLVSSTTLHLFCSWDQPLLWRQAVDSG